MLAISQDAMSISSTYNYKRCMNYLKASDDTYNYHGHLITPVINHGMVKLLVPLMHHYFSYSSTHTRISATYKHGLFSWNGESIQLSRQDILLQLIINQCHYQVKLLNLQVTMYHHGKQHMTVTDVCLIFRQKISLESTPSLTISIATKRVLYLVVSPTRVPDVSS